MSNLEEIRSVKSAHIRDLWSRRLEEPVKRAYDDAQKALEKEKKNVVPSKR